MEKSIAIIICHVGTLPWYFSYFAHSCKFNQTIDFFIITDDKSVKWTTTENVKFKYMTLEEINALANEKLNIETKLNRPYKLCDFKPTYGLLFSNLIEGYDFWGYGDIDVIFGNIREFITDELLSNHDIISVRHDFLTGYFQLFRNDEKMINLFRQSKDYERVLSSEQHFCFDETNFQFQAFSANLPLREINSEIESMMHVVKKMEEKGQLTAYFDFHVIEGLPGKLKWSEGRLFYKNKFEVLLYHLILFKKGYKFRNRVKFIPHTFYISPSRIYHTKSKPLVNDL